MEGAGRGSLPHLRGLDGLRGLAVLLVLLFHGGVPGFGGGFLGVSVFFTLSGYLITQLLVQEHERTGRVSLRAFWGRRLRRLAPASLAALVVIALAVLLTHAFPGTAVPGDVVAASLDVANWRFAVATTSYSDLFAAGPSPVLHFWSLAIEEQFYVLFPLVVVAVLARRRGRRRLPWVLATLVAIGTAASVAAPDDLAYYATFARAPELLAGALLALVLPIGHRGPAPAPRIRAAAGVAAIAVLAALVATSSPGSPWLFRGGLPAVSLLSVTIIASLAVRGPVRRAAEWRPLVALGLISYGVYVYHWPLFIVLDQERLGFGGPALLGVRLATTLIVATASAVLLEQPVRRGVRLRLPVPAGMSVIGGLATVTLVAVAASPAGSPQLAPQLEGDLLALSRDDTPVVDVLVLGSVPRLDEWVALAAPTTPRVHVHSAVQPACPLRLPDRDVGRCRSLRHAGASASATPPDLVVVGLGAEDRAELQDELARMASEAERLQATLDAFETTRQLVGDVLSAFPDPPILFVDTGPDDVLARELNEVDLQQERMTVSRASAGRFPDDLQARLSGVTTGRLRVLVIGDSTSYELAMALDAAGREQLEVAWAGRSNCELARTERLRWWRGSEHDGTACPSTARGWPEAAATLRPDVVVAAASLPALSEQRYGAGGPWTVPGAPAYLEAHDRAMADLQQMAAPYGAVTLVATIPPLLPGEGLNGDLGGPERLAAWTSQLQRWDAAWRSVGVVDWAAIALQAEAEAGHDLRIDAVHFDDAAVSDPIAPRFTAAVLAAIHRVQAETEATGCRVTLPSPHLDLGRCRV